MRLPRGRAVASVVSVEESLYDEDLGEVSGRSTHLQVAPILYWSFYHMSCILQ